MGQQQLVLLVLGVVLVALAFRTGLAAFDEQRVQRDQDAAVAEAIRIGEAMLAWKAKPRAYGGGAGRTNLTGLTFGLLGYATAADALRSDDATFGRLLQGVASSRPWVRVTPARSAGRVRVDLALFGPDPACLVLRTWRNEDGTWQDDGTPFAVDAVPADCPETWANR